MTGLFVDLYSCFRWFCLKDPEDSSVKIDDAPLDDELAWDLKEVREMAYYMSSIGGVVSESQKNHPYNKGTALESRMMKLALLALRNYKNNIPLDIHDRTKINSSIRVLTTAQKYYDLLLDRDYDFENNQQKAIALLQKQITILSNSESPKRTNMIFPGGWRGHAIMYGIQKNLKTGKYTFQLWNTGEGLEYHNKFGKKYQFRATWSDLSLEQISSEEFLKNLFKIKYQKRNNSDKTYNLIANHFQKWMDFSYFKSADYHQAKPYKNCAWKSIWSALADNLGRDEDPMLALQIKHSIIVILREKLLETIAPEEAHPIDPILIVAAKKIEKRIAKRISSEYMIKKLHKSDTNYPQYVKLLRAQSGKSFHILNKIPGFDLDYYSYFSYEFQKTCLNDPKIIKKICAPLKDPIDQLHNLSYISFSKLLNLCKTAEGITTYNKVCMALGEHANLQDIINTCENRTKGKKVNLQINKTKNKRSQAKARTTKKS